MVREMELKSIYHKVHPNIKMFSYPHMCTHVHE